MPLILALVESSLFLALSFIHFNWVFGGTWGFENTIPTNLEGEKVLNPKKFDSAIVGLFLFLFACLYLLKSALITVPIPEWPVLYGGWIISGIFILRSIGEFQYIGFFKRIKTTQFALLDTKYYSPLCLLIGIIGIVIELIS